MRQFGTVNQIVNSLTASDGQAGDKRGSLPDLALHGDGSAVAADGLQGKGETKSRTIDF